MRLTRMVLAAAGTGAEMLNFRDARRPGWTRGMAAFTFVVADSVTAGRLPAGVRFRVLRLLSDESLRELRSKWDEVTGQNEKASVAGGFRF